MKYIDAERLKSLIRERYNTYKIGQHSPFRNGKVEALRETIELIDSLQQEQPKIDFEKEIETYFKGWYMDETDQGYILHTPDDHAGLMSVKQVACYFSELGLNAGKEK